MSTEEVIAAISDALSPSKATAAKVVWEKFDGGWKYIISAHGMLCAGVPIVHTKFIVWADEDKATIKRQSLTYLYDLNCVYHTFRFQSIDDLKSQVTSIITTGMFGNKIKDLSSVMLEGQTSINAALAKSGITNISVMDFSYAPQFTVVPCAATTFQFKLNVNNKYEMRLSVAYEPKADLWRMSATHGSSVLNDTVHNADELPDMAANQVHKMLSNIQ